MADDDTPFVYKIGEHGSNIFSLSLQAGGSKEDVASTEELMANTRLIAAAPDLLEALHRFHPDVQHTPSTYARAVELAFNAITKATEGS